MLILQVSDEEFRPLDSVMALLHRTFLSWCVLFRHVALELCLSTKRFVAAFYITCYPLRVGTLCSPGREHINRERGFLKL